MMMVIMAVIIITVIIIDILQNANELGLCRYMWGLPPPPPQPIPVLATIVFIRTETMGDFKSGIEAGRAQETKLVIAYARM